MRDQDSVIGRATRLFERMIAAALTIAAVLFMLYIAGSFQGFGNSTLGTLLRSARAISAFSTVGLAICLPVELFARGGSVGRRIGRTVTLILGMSVGAAIAYSGSVLLVIQEYSG